jgi:hypothetical protein
MRGTAEQIALAEWLIKELDQRQPAQPSAPHEYRLAVGPDNVVRVFYLTHAQTPQRLQDIATKVRRMTEIRRLFIYNTPKAVALRGSADQIAMADRLIKESER